MSTSDSALQNLLSNTPAYKRNGHLLEIRGRSIIAKIPSARIGEVLEIHTENSEAILAEVVAVSENSCVLSAFSEAHGLRSGLKLSSLSQPFGFYVGSHLLGQSLNAFGSTLCGKTLEIAPDSSFFSPKSPVNKQEKLSPTETPFTSGVPAVDHLTPLAKGQRIGIYAEPGVGKSSLLAEIQRNSSAELKILALIGERNREIEEATRTLSAQDTIVIAASSSEPAAMRAMAAETAFGIAEYFRSQGKDVLLQLDSLSRLFRAYRELGLAGGEVPVRRGYPASAFARLPPLIERAGSRAEGSITAIFSLLLSEDLEQDPLNDEVKGLLDGHIYLSKQLAERGLYPAIDISSSLSRLERVVLTPEQLHCMRVIRSFHSEFLETERLLKLGAQAGANFEAQRLLHQQLERLIYKSNQQAGNLWEEFYALSKAVIDNTRFHAPETGPLASSPKNGTTQGLNKAVHSPL